MKIAVASEDGVMISRHFGRSACFIVFEIEDQKIKNREVRTNSYTAFARGECHGEQGQQGHAHGHSAIVNALHDCQAVLCYGMGWRAAEDLKSKNIQPFECMPEDAVLSFIKGELRSAANNFCQCHGG